TLTVTQKTVEAPVMPADGESNALPIARWAAVLITLLAIALGVFQLYTAGYRPLNLFYQRGFHLMIILIIAFLAFPLGRRKRGAFAWTVDGLWIAASACIGAYLIIDLDGIISRSGFF